jgi:hypothetical protein
MRFSLVDKVLCALMGLIVVAILYSLMSDGLTAANRLVNAPLVSADGRH